MSTAFRISLDGAQQVPSVVTTASGLGTAIFDSATSSIGVNINVQGLDWGPLLGLSPQTLSTAADDMLKEAGAERFLEVVEGGDYFGLLAYLPPDREPFDSALQEIRTAIGKSRRCATILAELGGAISRENSTRAA